MITTSVEVGIFLVRMSWLEETPTSITWRSSMKLYQFLVISFFLLSNIAMANKKCEVGVKNRHLVYYYLGKKVQRNRGKSPFTWAVKKVHCGVTTITNPLCKKRKVIIEGGIISNPYQVRLITKGEHDYELFVSNSNSRIVSTGLAILIAWCKRDVLCTTKMCRKKELCRAENKGIFLSGNFEISTQFFCSGKLEQSYSTALPHSQLQCKNGKGVYKFCIKRENDERSPICNSMLQYQAYRYHCFRRFLIRLWLVRRPPCSAFRFSFQYAWRNFASCKR